MFPQTLYDKANMKESYNLAEIKDFQGLSPKSHKAHVPVYALTDEGLDARGAALNAMQNNRKIFGELYSTMSDKLMMLLNG